MLLHTVHDLVASSSAHSLVLLPAQGVPNPAPQAPPGAQKMEQILSYFKWIALGACAVAFMGGLIAFTAGRVIDNRRYGNTGSLMMLASIGGALLFGIGPQILNTFAGTQ